MGTVVAVLTQDHDPAVAQGIVAQARVLGGSIGVAASNALFNHYSQTRLSGVLSPAQIAQLQHSTSAITGFTPFQKNAIRLAYAFSFNQSMRICLYIAAFCLVASIFTYQRDPPSLAKLAAQHNKLPETAAAGPGMAGAALTLTLSRVISIMGPQEDVGTGNSSISDGVTRDVRRPYES